MKNGLLIVLSGPSGVGKGTIRQKLIENNPQLDLSYSISMTTRPPRQGEVDGVDYFFVTEQQFKDQLEQNQLLEWAKFVGNYYGTPEHYVRKLLNEGRNVVLEIEVDGATQIMKKFPEATFIFIVPPSLEELEKRIRNRRTEPEDIIQLRLQKAKKEILLKDRYKYIVENSTIDLAIEHIVNIISQNLKRGE